MNSVNRGFRWLGVAFLLQFVTSFSNGVFIQPMLIVPGDIGETLSRIAAKPGLMQSYILLDMLTALGVIFLGVMLYQTLKGQNEKIAMVALGFYILEGALLAVSRLNAFELLKISQLIETSGDPILLQSLAQVTLESMDFVGVTLHMIAFSAGAILFYFLLVRSRVVPAALSLWGLIAVMPFLPAVVLQIFEIEFPFVLALPYIPFELVIGIWFLVRGIRQDEMAEYPIRPEAQHSG